MAEPATIALVQADYVGAEGTRLLVRRWEGGGDRAAFFWHGGGGASNEFPEIAPALVDAGYAVYAPDAPGYGESPSVEAGGYRPSALARLAAGLIVELEIAPVVWVGSSWGASIGVHTAVRTPDLFAALVLLDGGYFDPTDDPRHPTRSRRRRFSRLGSTGIPVLLLHATEPAEYEPMRVRALERFRGSLPAADVIALPAGHTLLTEAGAEVRRRLLDWLGRGG